MRLILLTLLSLAGGIAWGAVDFGSLRPAGYVSDYAQVLGAKERGSLEELLREINTQYSVQIAVVTLPSLQGTNIAEASRYLYDSWGVGRNTSDKSALMIISPQDNSMHLYVGMGLRGVLNTKWSAVLADRVGDLMVQEKFNSAAIGAVTAMAQRIHMKAGSLPKRSLGTGMRASSQIDEASPSGPALPIAAMAAGGFGLILLVSTFMRAKQNASVYEMGRDFERGRTGAFGNKKPRWL